MNAKKLYGLLGVACTTGYLWLVVSVCFGVKELGLLKFCFFKTILNFPCPACGTTRAVTELLHGDVAGAFLINPFGIIVSAIMFITPFWLLYDLVYKRQTLFENYIAVETRLRKKIIAAPLVLLVAANWAWNIFKGL